MTSSKEIPSIPDVDLLKHAQRVQGKVVVITGAANGFGREVAKLFAKSGAKVVVSDLNLSASQAVVNEIAEAGGDATAVKCDVTSWDDQTSLFDATIAKYGRVDVVIPNAGIGEVGHFETLQFQDGRPVKPNLKTVDIDLIGVLYTVHIGLHYLKQKPEKGSMRAIIFIGSMASWQAVNGGPLYAATKHSMLGLMRSLYPPCRAAGIRVGTIHPWFSPTAILTQMSSDMVAALEGIPLTPVDRVAGAIFYAASDPDSSTNGRAWMLPDDQPLLTLPREQLREGVYRLLDEKLKERIKVSQQHMHAKAKL